jgi:hypothetical protein
MNPRCSVRLSASSDDSFVFSTIDATLRAPVIASRGQWNGPRVRQEADSLSSADAAQIIEVDGRTAVSWGVQRHEFATTGCGPV